MKAKGRVLITGAARRIGRTVALALAQAGWDIAAHYNSSADEAETLAAEIHALGRNATLIQADLEKTKGIESLVAALTPETTALSTTPACSSATRTTRQARGTSA
jgi:NAD(P)-dependent dehydrogenase (short-subunit alcohol dehydrogenase family)